MSKQTTLFESYKATNSNAALKKEIVNMKKMLKQLINATNATNASNATEDARFDYKNYTTQVPTPIRPEWYSLNNANRVICTLCSKHEHMFRGQQLNCMVRKGKGGQLSHLFRLDRHVNCSAHKFALQLEEESGKERMAKGLQNINYRNKVATINCFRAILHSVKRAHSLRDTESLYDFMENMDVDIGQKNHSHVTMRRMIIFIHSSFLKQLKKLLAKDIGNEKFYKRHISIAMDKISMYKRQWQICNVRFQVDGNPVHLHLDLAPVSDEHTIDGCAEAGGWSMFQKMIDSIQDKCGIKFGKETVIEEEAEVVETIEVIENSEIDEIDVALGWNSEIDDLEDDLEDDSEDDSDDDVPLHQLAETLKRKRQVSAVPPSKKRKINSIDMNKALSADEVSTNINSTSRIHDIDIDLTNDDNMHNDDDLDGINNNN